MIQIRIVAVFCILLLFTACKEEKIARTPTTPVNSHKVLIIDSYGPKNDWSSTIIKAIHREFNKENTLNEYQIKSVHLRSKKKKKMELKETITTTVKTIENWQPDIIIACDDNASKYIVKPFLKDSEIPVIFCGINWSLSEYGYPYKNTTGILEVSHIIPALNYIKPYCKGERIGFMFSDTYSERKILTSFQQKLQEDIKIWPVETFEELQSKFKKAQEECDILLLGELASIEGFSNNGMKELVESNTIVPTLTDSPLMVDYAMMCLPKQAEEHGSWSAKTAKRILNGESPESIPIAENKNAIFHINKTIYTKLGINLPQTLMDKAVITE
ncbi:MAG: hypothetical protein NE334_03745 [Lentisphaeraceae bacterium]|nr:hypothetical protein [Lentisphaeraceae bacterium]